MEEAHDLDTELAGAAGHATSGPDAADATEPSLPRPLLWIGVPVAGIVLTLVFFFLQFPFDRFRDTLAQQAGQALGAQVAVGRLEPSLGLAGPRFVASEVVVSWPDGASSLVSRAALRPAWSLAWLRGRPALHVDAEADLGNATGTLVLGDPMAWDGELRGVDLDRLPLEQLGGGVSLEGRLDLDADLRFAPRGPVGEARFEARDGSVQAGALPMAIPYTELRGQLRFGEDGSLDLDGVALDGPMISARVEGGAGAGPSPWTAPLDLDLRLEVSDRNIRPALRSAGLRLRPDGTVDMKVRGTLARPVVR